MEIQLNLKSELSDHQGAIREIQIHQDAKMFFARSDDMLILYDLKRNRKIKGFYGSAGFEGATFASDGKSLLYFSEEKIHFWDLGTWKEKMVISGELYETRDRDAHAESGLWAISTEQNAIAVRRLETDEDDPPDFILEGHTNYIECLRFHPTGKVLASGAADKTIRFWDIQERSEISNWQVHEDFVTSLAFSPDGKIVISGDYSGNLKIWDMKMI